MTTGLIIGGISVIVGVTGASLFADKYGYSSANLFLRIAAPVFGILALAYVLFIARGLFL